LQAIVAPPSQIRLARSTGLSVLQSKPKALVFNEKQPTAKVGEGLLLFSRDDKTPIELFVAASNLLQKQVPDVSNGEHASYSTLRRD
jgi:hypothetical protein